MSEVKIDIHAMTLDHQLAVGKIFYDVFCEDKTFCWCFEPQISGYEKRFLAFTYSAHDFHLHNGMAVGAFLDDELVGFLYVLASNVDIPDDHIGWEKMAAKCGETAAKRMQQWSDTTAPTDAETVCYKISLVGVSKQHQGKGIGKKLLAWLDEQCLINTQFEGIQLDTAKMDNVHLYERLGYRITAEIPFLDDVHFVMFKTRGSCINKHA